MIKLEKINREEAYRYLGYGNSEPDEKIKLLADECEKALLAEIKPNYVYKAFDITHTEQGIELDGTGLVLSGNDIEAHLDGCIKAVLMCATISSAADKLIRVTQLEDMTKALIMDSFASAAIEQVCNLVDEIIKEDTKEYYQTWRYSPGYGDLPISLQNPILDVLNAQKRIGLCCNESSILTPRKSVTAVIGLSENELSRKKRGCSDCNLKDVCQFRKRGDRCEY